jgi:hypothetical protein
MQTVRPHQEWDVKLLGQGDWRRARVINVLGEQVEIQFLDASHLPDLARTVTIRASAMNNRAMYRLVSDPG